MTFMLVTGIIRCLGIIAVILTTRYLNLSFLYKEQWIRDVLLFINHFTPSKLSHTKTFIYALQLLWWDYFQKRKTC